MTISFKLQLSLKPNCLRKKFEIGIQSGLDSQHWLKSQNVTGYRTDPDDLDSEDFLVDIFYMFPMLQGGGWGGAGGQEGGAAQEGGGRQGGRRRPGPRDQDQVHRQ